MPTITVARLRRAFRRETIGVDVASALDLVGGLLKWLGLAYLVPAALAVAWDEPAWPFLVGGALVSGFGLALDGLTRGEKETVRPREGFLVVALIWLLVPAFGAVPFVLGDVD